MCTVSGKFCFHNVGQGGFYSGMIKCDKNNFTFVYDCGTLSPHKFVTDAIKDFSRSIEVKEKLNLLVLSHMDADHVNGVSDLINICNIRQIDILVMPYMTLLDRTILLSYYTKRSPDNNSEWYYEFIIDPIGFFSGKDININHIVFVSNRDEYDERNEDILQFDDLNCEFVGWENKKKENTLLVEYNKSEGLTNRLHCIENFKINSYKKWKFEFWCDCREFRTGIYEKVKNKITELGLNINSIDSIRDVFDNKRKELAACYGETRIAPNDMSVVLLHYPIIESFSSNIDLAIMKPFEYGCLLSSACYPLLNNQGDKNKTLLLGDINLKSTFTEIWDYFNLTDIKDEILICTVPHHGSRYSWECEIINRCADSIFVVSSGIHGRFKHPHNDVVRDFKKYCNTPLLWNNEYSKIYISLKDEK